MGDIPCTEDNLRVKYASCSNLVPTWRKSQAASLAAEGKTVYDIFFDEAELLVVVDLKKFAKPLRVSDFANTTPLTQLKAFKTLELLFRQNTQQEGDKWDRQAMYYGSQYEQMLRTMPVETYDGANYTPTGGRTRTS